MIGRLHAGNGATESALDGGQRRRTRHCQRQGTIMLGFLSRSADDALPGSGATRSALAEVRLGPDTATWSLAVRGQGTPGDSRTSRCLPVRLCDVLQYDVPHSFSTNDNSLRENRWMNGGTAAPTHWQGPEWLSPARTSTKKTAAPKYFRPGSASMWGTGERTPRHDPRPFARTVGLRTVVSISNLRIHIGAGFLTGCRSSVTM
jgi:hypothetical protein